MERLMRTLAFAAEKHAGQCRHGGKGIPYVNHPISVAHWVAKAGGSEIAVCASVLHDVREECQVTEQEILDLYADDPGFGRAVLAVVNEHTDPPGLPYAEIKRRETTMMAEGRYLPDTSVVIIADQLSNMIDLVVNPPKWGNGEEAVYIEQMKTLIDAGRGTSVFLETAFDDAYRKAKEFYGT